ncbi:MAG: PASTA domain-containing protein [Thermodesulfovibrionales bacterium]|nr:PASTA domain-containing protein [Thermodesulfovibrionales bacterium]
MRKKIIKFLLYSFLLLTLGLMAGHFTFELLSYNKIIEMPNLKGKNVEEAQRIVSSLRLQLRLDGEEHDNQIPQGHILKQDIKAGYKLKEGREVGIIISKGPRIKEIPNLTGKSLDEAEEILKEKGLKLSRIIFVHTPFYDKNIIIAQRPEPIESGGNLFSVVVSLGNSEELR